MDSEKYFKKKYIKYKSKYIQLQNISGGGIETARNYFYSQFLHNHVQILNLFKNDHYFITLLTALYAETSEVPTLDVAVVELQIQEILNKPISVNEKKNSLKNIDMLNKIFETIKRKVNNDKLLDLFVKIYLSGNLGVPSSIENTVRFKDNIEKFNILKNNKKSDQNINDFNSLSDLENFIDQNKHIVDEIIEKKTKNQRAKTIYKKIKEIGEDDVQIELETNNIIVYVPTSENGSKYYGSGTKWCTAGKNNNMFNYYNNQGPLYIVVSKHTHVKYQLHFESRQFMNVQDSSIKLQNIADEFNDANFTSWAKHKLKNECLKKIKRCEFATNQLDDLKDDEEIVLKSIIYNKENFPEHVSDRLKNDKNFAMKVLRNCKISPHDFAYFSNEIKDDEEIMTYAVHKNSRFFLYASNRLRNNINLAAEFIDKSNQHFFPDELLSISDDLRDNTELMTYAINKTSEIYPYVSDRLKNDIHFVKNVIDKNYSLTYNSIFEKDVPKELKDNDELMSYAIEKNVKLFNSASERLKNDKNFILKFIGTKNILKYVSDELKDDNEIVMNAIQNDASEFTHASNRLKHDVSFLTNLVKINGLVLQYFDSEYQNDYSIVIEAVKQNGIALAFASNLLKENLDIVSTAIAQNNHAKHYGNVSIKRPSLNIPPVRNNTPTNTTNTPTNTTNTPLKTSTKKIGLSNILKKK